MLDWLKSAWERWKVHVSVAGGILVVATAYGTCTYEPPSEPVSVEDAATETTSVEAATTTTGTSATTGETTTTE
jgi:hypothetical protein